MQIATPPQPPESITTTEPTAVDKQPKKINSSLVGKTLVRPQVQRPIPRISNVAGQILQQSNKA